MRLLLVLCDACLHRNICKYHDDLKELKDHCKDQYPFGSDGIVLGYKCKSYTDDPKAFRSYKDEASLAGMTFPSEQSINEELE